MQDVVPQPRLEPQTLRNPFALSPRRHDPVVEGVVQRSVDLRPHADGEMVVRGNEAAIVHVVAEAVAIAARLARRIDVQLHRAHLLVRVVQRREAQLDVVVPHRRRVGEPQRVRNLVSHRSTPT